MDNPSEEQIEAALDVWYDSCNKHMRLYPEGESCYECDEEPDEIHDLLFDAPGG